jgi:hypothetical protein
MGDVLSMESSFFLVLISFSLGIIASKSSIDIFYFFIILLIIFFLFFIIFGKYCHYDN